MRQFDMCFPLSFFDTLEHYMIYLADQIFVLYPMYMHCMYPYEHHMVVIKDYVRNRARPEGSMIGLHNKGGYQVLYRLWNVYKFLYSNVNG
jgi:hypothetical protein